MMPNDQVILVTGSSRGIGAGLVKAFAQRGDRVIINYAHSEEMAHDLYHEVAASVGNDRILKVKADVSQRPAIRALFEQAIAKFGRVDVLINNAGVNIDRPFTELDDTQWEQVVATVLTGTFICSQEFVFHLREGNGHIINIGATTGIRGRKNGANYCSAKAGVMVLTKCLALELAPRIRVNCVTPGYIDTDEVMDRFGLNDPATLERVVATIPMQRIGTPADVFKVIDFIVNGSEYITGQNFFVNGGYFMY